MPMSQYRMQILSNIFTEKILYFVPQKQLLRDLTAYRNEPKQCISWAHSKLQRCQTQQSGMQITAGRPTCMTSNRLAIAQCNGSTLLKIPPNNTT